MASDLKILAMSECLEIFHIPQKFKLYHINMTNLMAVNICLIIMKQYDTTLLSLLLRDYDITHIIHECIKMINFALLHGGKELSDDVEVIIQRTYIPHFVTNLSPYMLIHMKMPYTPAIKQCFTSDLAECTIYNEILKLKTISLFVLRYVIEYYQYCGNTVERAILITFMHIAYHQTDHDTIFCNTNIKNRDFVAAYAHSLPSHNREILYRDFALFNMDKNICKMGIPRNVLIKNIFITLH